MLFEDDGLIAVNKPAGMVVHPTFKNPSGTLLDELRARAADWPDDRNPTIVGRLDKYTSGIVIAAKTRSVHSTLQRMLSVPETEKEYLAVVNGFVADECGTIALPLRIDPADRRRVAVAPQGEGQSSETEFRRLSTDEDTSVLLCRLRTGRRHQIRVHLAARGWPVVGDRVYGQPLAGFERHALHAWRLSVRHPVSGARLTIEAPIPLELSERWPGLTPEA